VIGCNLITFTVTNLGFVGVKVKRREFRRFHGRTL
jgi:hypothetical protein